jgi:hypothetical protein
VGVGGGPPNDEMQRTRHGENEASPLISVFYGRPNRFRGVKNRAY